VEQKAVTGNHRKRRQDAEGKNRHQAVISAINSVASEFARANRQHVADRRSQNVVERKKACREKWTIGGLFASALGALLAIVATGVAIYFANRAAAEQHKDTGFALTKADKANQTAEKQIRQDQRPWIYVKQQDTEQIDRKSRAPEQPAFDFVPGKEVSVELKMTNFGKWSCPIRPDRPRAGNCA
jgi:hypothetical protein